MLKILTDLNDYEIAKQKWAKRAKWHMNMQLRNDNPEKEVSLQELNGRGIHWGRVFPNEPKKNSAPFSSKSN